MIHPSTERALNPYASSTTKKPTGMSRISLPSYDTGIDRVPEDQIALIHEGEKVVPADENPDNGAPADFSGRVIPNPRGIQPILGTDIERLRPADTDHLSRGARANINNAPLVNPNGDVSNPPATEVIPARGRLISTADQSKAKARDTVDNPGAQTTASTAPDELIQDRDMKEQPTKGGLLADQYLKHIGLPAITRPNPEPTPTAGYQPIKTAASAVVPKETLQLIPGTPENREYHQDTAGGALIPGAPSTYDKATTRDFAQMRYKAKLADYDKRIQDARDAATPEGQEQADRLTLAKLSFQKANPWGSEGNHPGILGKIGHVAEIVASRAPGIAPIMATLPESEVGRAEQTSTAQGNLEKDTQLATQRAAEEDKSSGSGVGKTTQELTYHDLMTGNAGKPRLNPDTQQPYTAMEANVASQGTGKGTDEEYIQAQMKEVNPDTDKKFTRREATENLLQLKAGNRPVSRQEQALKDYMQAQELADTPANRDAARIAVTRRDVQTKALAALPIQEQRSTFDNNLHQESALLEQTHADALQRGKSADEIQQKENARHEAVVSKIQTAQDTVKSADESEFAAAISPVTTLLAVTSAEGVKRVNREELARFVPQNGDLWRWATTHTDQWLAGEIPDQYRDEVRKMLVKMEAQEDREHLANTHSVDATIRQGAQTPGKGNKSESSKNSAGPTKGDEQTHNGFVYVFDGTHYVKDHAVGK